VVEAVDAGTDTVFASTDHTLSANVENLVLTGTGSIDGLGNALNNVLTGNAGKNVLNGGAGNDTINGGAGTDLLTGGAGNDTFVFASASDAGVDAKKADVVTDFGGGDYIDLQLIDAITGTAVDDAFSWIGGNAFHKVSGELRFDVASGNLSGDVNGDGKADFMIHLDGVAAAAALDGHFVF
jgi:serralysin